MAIDELHNDILRVFNDVCVRGGKSHATGTGFCPLADVYFEEDTREIVVRLELPGMTRDQIELFVDRRSLMIRGRREFAGGEHRVYQQVEMDYGAFERRIRLGVDVDVSRTQATYEAGVLEVHMPLVPHEGKAQPVPIHVEDTDE